MDNSIKEKYLIFCQIQKDNTDALSKLFKLYITNIIILFVFFIFINFLYISDVYSFPSTYSDLIPKIYKGKQLIIKNSSMDFYNFSGVIYFLIICSTIVFLLIYTIVIFTYKIKIRLNKYEIKDYLLCFVFILMIFFDFYFLFMGTSRPDTVSIFGGAIYRGNYFLGIIVPMMVFPTSLVFMFGAIVMNFLILSKRA